MFGIDGYSKLNTEWLDLYSNPKILREEITAFNQADATITNESFNEFRAYIKDLHQTALSHFYDRQFIMIPYKNENGQIYLSFAETVSF